MTDVEEFQEIRITIHRNSDWLHIFERRGFYLSKEFPLITLQLPHSFKRMEEKDIDNLKEFIKKELMKTELELEEL